MSRYQLREKAREAVTAQSYGEESRYGLKGSQEAKRSKLGRMESDRLGCPKRAVTG